MIKLYENIKTLRKEHSWSQEELAKKMGYTDRSMIAKIESGSVDLSESKIMGFSKVFNVSPWVLMGLDVSMEPAAASGSSSPATDLRPDEKDLLSYYNLLDSEDRAEARGYVKGLMQSEKYRIDSVKEVG